MHLLRWDWLVEMEPGDQPFCRAELVGVYVI
jgi:hypothetical protein